ncbi:MAG: SIS domain-containing protein [candidate division NC10 bacterium]|nr:SIS domain-containing protein [candidate division NC10 bacterium]
MEGNRQRISAYYEVALTLLSRIEKTQGEVLDQAAEAIFASLKEGGVLHVFGSGHSHALAEEVFHRAGGLVPVNAILEDFLTPHFPPAMSGKFERLSGVATILLDYYDPRPGEVLMIASNSGINPVPIEMALLGKERGLFVVAVTSFAHSERVPSRHPSGKKLYEVADVVIDNCGKAGDAAVAYPGLSEKVAPTSSLAGIFIMNSLLCRVVERFLASGLMPPVYLSANLPGGEEHNKALEERYRGRIKGL